MSDCEAYEGLLAAEADGALAGEDRVALLSHLGGCAACRTRLDEQRAVASLLSRQDPPPVGRQEWSAQWQRIAETLPASRTRRPRTLPMRLPFWLPASMAAALGFAVVLWLLAGRGSASPAGPLQMARAGEASIEELAIDDERATGMIIETSPEYAAVIWIDSGPRKEAPS